MARKRSASATSLPVVAHKHKETGTNIPTGELRTLLADFCRRNHIRRLALFGSMLRGEARSGSDLDLLVEFEPGHVPGFEFVTIEDELSSLLGRTVDLNTYGSLSRYFRDDVRAHAEVIYVESRRSCQGCIHGSEEPLSGDSLATGGKDQGLVYSRILRHRT